tara:strand:- start:539 stop:1171 length:633 start_codon:yes stop_codon:yes gene_type:complete
MSEEKYEGRHWSEELRTYKVDGEWEHRFTVRDMKVKMGTPDGGYFRWSHEVDGFHFSGGHWYGDHERLPREVCFDVEWEHVDEKKVKEAEEKYEAALGIFVNKENIWEKLDEDEDADEEDVEDAEYAMNNAEWDANNAYDELERAKESEWMHESITVEMWGSIDNPQTCCREEVPGFDDWEPIFAVAEGLRSMCYKIYSEGREHKGEVVA